VRYAPLGIIDWFSYIFGWMWAFGKCPSDTGGANPDSGANPIANSHSQTHLSNIPSLAQPFIYIYAAPHPHFYAHAVLH
jgi:hypothetical protein